MPAGIGPVSIPVSIPPGRVALKASLAVGAIPFKRLTPIKLRIFPILSFSSGAALIGMATGILNGANFTFKFVVWIISVSPPQSGTSRNGITLPFYRVSRPPPLFFAASLRCTRWAHACDSRITAYGRSMNIGIIWRYHLADIGRVTFDYFPLKVEPAVGIEPTTDGLQNQMANRMVHYHTLLTTICWGFHGSDSRETLWCSIKQ